MRKIVTILIIAVAMLLGTGCTNDDYYPIVKKVYAGGKAVVEANADKLSDDTLEKLKKVDAAATTYDFTRTEVKQILEAKPNE